MTFVDRLRAAAGSDQVGFNIFLATFRTNGSVVWAFLEGKDDMTFYAMHIGNRLPNGYRVEFVRCGSRKDVLDRHADAVRRFGENPRTLFFVDRDVQWLCGVKESVSAILFVTYSYSIENEVCSVEVARRYVIEALGVDSASSVVKEVESQFDASWRQFLGAVRTFVVWVVAVRRAAMGANLQNIDTSKILRFDRAAMAVMAVGTLLDYLHATTGKNERLPDLPAGALEEAERLLTTQAAFERALRGKQAVWFMVQFLTAVEEGLAEGAGIKRSKVPLQVGNAIQILAHRVSKPKGLYEFLEPHMENLPAVA